jgi:predicted transcriptional regulator
MVSSITTAVGVRLENELLVKLDALAAARSEPRTATAREALRRGLDLLEAQQQQRQDEGPEKRRPIRRGQSRREKGPVQRTKSPEPKTGDRAKAPPRPAPAAQELRAFASDVLEAARQVPRAKNPSRSQDRVFISHAWRQYKRQRPESALDLDAFKARLLEANRERFLSLVCDDMAPAHKAADVQASELQHLSATFHLVCI